MEKWRRIPGFPHHEASNEGRIRRKAHTIRFTSIRTGREVETRLPELILKGKYQVSISATRRESRLRLVRLAFPHSKT